MAFITRLINLNELQVNGQSVDDNDEFTAGEEDTKTNAEAQGEAPADIAQNDAENAAENTDTQDTATADQPQAQTDNRDDAEDDFTLDDTEEPAPEATEDNPPAEEPTEGETDTPTQDDTTGGEAPEDTGDDDFTVDGAGGGDQGADTEGGDNTQQTPPDKQAPANPTDAITDDDDRAAEEAIYDSLTDDQKRIRVLQLKLNYKDLYETITTTIEGVNGIPKDASNLETIKRLIMLLTKARNILVDYVENNFDSTPYLENYTMYIKYIAVFRTASKVIEELNNAKK